MSPQTVFLFFLFFFVSTMYGQSKYYKSYSDYMNNDWTAVDSLSMTLRSQGQKIWSGGADFKPQAGNKVIDKILKKDARFIIHNDTLYVNCKGLKYQGCVLGSWYAPGFRYGADKICFICTKTGREEVSKNVMFGAIGAHAQ